MRTKARKTRDERTAAEALAAEGNMLEAINVLTVANRARQDDAVERRLVELRTEACTQVDETSGLPSWPPDADELFPECDGVPEVAAGALTPEILRSGILRHGCLLVRGLIGRKRVKRLVKDIDRAFAAHDAQRNGGGSPSPWYTPFDPGSRYPEGYAHREWIRSGGGVLAVDSPRSLFDVIETFEEVGIGELITAYLGEHPMLLAGKWTLRRMAPDEHQVLTRDAEDAPGWHQDGAFMGAGIRSIDLWLSLSQCGEHAPGLDIVARRLNQIIDPGTEDAHFDWSVGNTAAQRVSEGAIVRPMFEPGDALFFDHMLLHRTALDRHMTRVRYAIEAWFAAPSSYPHDQIPIAY